MDIALHRTPAKRGPFEIAVTLVPLVLFWTVAIVSVQRGWWVGLIFTGPAATFLVRGFLIQHGCGALPGQMYLAA